MAQDKIANFYEDLGTRIAFIREKQRVTLDELSEGKPTTAKSWEQGKMPRSGRWRHIASRLGLSESFIFNAVPVTREDYAFIDKWRDQIGDKSVRYERPPERSMKIEERGAPGRTGSPMIFPAEESSGTPRQPATLSDCERYFLEYLHKARHDPNAAPYIWRQLQKHFPMDEFEE